MSPAGNFGKVVLDQLYLPFLQRLLAAIAACNERGVEYRATAGFRSYDEQQRLYFQGRTAPGNVVTDAMGWYSPHNYGLAVDFVAWEKGKPSWSIPAYSVLGEEAERVGLVWGGEFHHPHDRPHVQWPGYVHAKELEPLRRIAKANPSAPLTAVWAYLDTLPHQEAGQLGVPVKKAGLLPTG